MLKFYCDQTFASTGKLNVKMSCQNVDLPSSWPSEVWQATVCQNGDGDQHFLNIPYFCIQNAFQGFQTPQCKNKFFFY